MKIKWTICLCILLSAILLVSCSKSPEPVPAVQKEQPPKVVENTTQEEEYIEAGDTVLGIESDGSTEDMEEGEIPANARNSVEIKANQEEITEIKLDGESYKIRFTEVLDEKNFEMDINGRKVAVKNLETIDLTKKYKINFTRVNIAPETEEGYFYSVNFYILKKDNSTSFGNKLIRDNLYEGDAKKYTFFEDEFNVQMKTVSNDKKGKKVLLAINNQNFGPLFEGDSVKDGELIVGIENIEENNAEEVGRATITFNVVPK